MYDWIGSLGCLGGSDPVKLRIHADLMDEAALGIWPEPFARAAAAGVLPGYDGYTEVIEAVFAERMQLSALQSVRARGAERRLARDVLA